MKPIHNAAFITWGLCTYVQVETPGTCRPPRGVYLVTARVPGGVPARVPGGVPARVPGGVPARVLVRVPPAVHGGVTVIGDKLCEFTNPKDM